MRKSSRNTRVVMGVAWNRPEPWARLLDISVDRDQLEATHAEWRKHADKQLKRLRREGLDVRRVDVDVEELVAFCEKKGMDVNSEARAAFASDKINRSCGVP